MCQATARKGGVGSKLGRRSDDGVISSVPVPHLSMKSFRSLCLVSFESHAIPPEYAFRFKVAASAASEISGDICLAISR